MKTVEPGSLADQEFPPLGPVRVLIEYRRPVGERVVVRVTKSNLTFRVDADDIIEGDANSGSAWVAGELTAKVFEDANLYGYHFVGVVNCARRRRQIPYWALRAA